MIGIPIRERKPTLRRPPPGDAVDGHAMTGARWPKARHALEQR
jgi:hypothetical protein